MGKNATLLTHIASFSSLRLIFLEKQDSLVKKDSIKSSFPDFKIITLHILKSGKPDLTESFTAFATS